MGIISLERIDNLIWLGRYSERIYLTIKEFFSCYDKMLDDPNLYKEYCYALQIPMIYENPKDFIERYVCDPTISDSLLSNLFRAYDNCIVLRNEIGSETLSYLELALTDLESIRDFESFIIDLQSVLDHILAFWACLDDTVSSSEVRSIVKLGKRLERMDLYLRLRKDKQDLAKAFRFLEYRINKNTIAFDKEKFIELKKIMNEKEIHYYEAIEIVEGLLD